MCFLFFIISLLSVICMFAKALIELSWCDWVMKVQKGLFTLCIPVIVEWLFNKFNEIQSLANMFCLASSDIGFNIYNSWTGQNKSYLNMFCLHEYACVHNINSLRFNAESYVCCFWCVFFFLHHFKNCSIHIFLNFLSLSDYLSLTFNALVSSGCKSK